MPSLHPNHTPITSRVVALHHHQQRCGLPGLAFAVVFLIVLVPIASCGKPASHSQQMRDASRSGFRLESSAFREGEPIPRRFTCSGEDTSPALHWTAPPARTRSLVLIVEDPDAPGGVWTHWMVFNLPASARSMPENVPKQGEVPGGGLQGTNSFGHIGYGGPCPPPGKPHRYFFRLYALDTMLSLKAGASRQEVLEAAKGHILAQAHLMGRFGR